MRRVVITGIGIVSSIGIGVSAVLAALKDGTSGLRLMPEFVKNGFRCHVSAPIVGFDRDQFKNECGGPLSITAQYGLAAAMEAIADAGLAPHSDILSRAGVFIGSGGGGQSQLPPTQVPSGENGGEPGFFEIARQMNETAAVAIARKIGARGRVTSVSAACTTGLYDLGYGYEMIASGLHDCCICGGSEEESWQRVGVSADNSQGMPSKFNDNPEAACRPFDRDRLGFIISEGSAALLLETYESASARNAPIYAEIVGYAANNDGHDLYVASGIGMRNSVTEALRQAAMSGVTKIEYVNAHATGTPVGDVIEARVLSEFFGMDSPVSSCKGTTGHSQGAAGAQEAIYTTLMMKHGFFSPTANLENVDEECACIDHVRTLREGRITTALTLNNGLGGTNAALVLKAV